MSIFLAFAFFAISAIDSGATLAVSAQEPAVREWTSKSSKGSKSTDHPTLFPTLNPTLFPTVAPTYCGKASKSWSSGRRDLQDGVVRGDWTSKSSKSGSCYSGSRSWRRAAGGGAYKILHGVGVGNGGKRNRDLEEEEQRGPEFKPDDVKVRRRRINNDRKRASRKRASLD